MTPQVQAAGVIVYLQEEKELLFLLLRGARHGEWGAPKGKQDAGESELETAVREAYEEAGLRHLRFKPNFRETLTYEIQMKGKQATKHVTYFLAQLESDEIALSQEHTEAHMATLEEIEQLIPHEAMREVFRKAARYVAAHG